MGSGIPELVAYLNGANIKKIFNVKTFMARFFSCLFAVSSGLPVGPEAPMIALGSIVGANLPFGRSETLGFDVYDWHFFAQFRNIRDQRDFISAGAAAGVAAAFSSPIGGLIFSMEEVSLFWSVPLMIRIFVCAMAADFTANLLASTCGGFSCSALTGGGEFASFGSDSIIFRSWHSIDANLQMLPVAVIIGALGGSLGALFTFCNLKIQVRTCLQNRILLTGNRALVKPKRLPPSPCMTDFSYVAPTNGLACLRREVVESAIPHFSHDPRAVCDHRYLDATLRAHPAVAERRQLRAGQRADGSPQTAQSRHAF